MSSKDFDASSVLRLRCRGPNTRGRRNSNPLKRNWPAVQDEERYGASAGSSRSSGNRFMVADVRRPAALLVIDLRQVQNRWLYGLAKNARYCEDHV
jgi:hypothetical protein